ncbi:hypothetical protein HDU93_009577 [Gonapodya sp. JEL0774]|nr:hypothetical protein HDU93_009577 [Gonapodya sp. JEL0774]
MSGPLRPKELHALTHSREVGAIHKYRADTSTQVAFNFIDDPSREDSLGIKGREVIVSNDHFDHDGLTGVTVLLDSEWAKSKRDLLIAVATSGDFFKFRNRTAARIVWVIDAFSGRVDGIKSPLPEDTFKFKDFPELFDKLYTEMVPRFKTIVEEVESGGMQEYWKTSEKEWELTVAAIESGLIRISKHPELSLAIVRLDSSLKFEPSRFALYSYLAYHGTDGDCVFVVTEKNGVWEGRYRYEMNVDYVTAALPPRLHLGGLADVLTSMESGGDKKCTWQAGDPEDSHGTVLKSSAQTTVKSDEVERTILEWYKGVRKLAVKAA